MNRRSFLFGALAAGIAAVIPRKKQEQSLQGWDKPEAGRYDGFATYDPGIPSEARYIRLVCNGNEWTVEHSDGVEFDKYGTVHFV